MNASVTLQQSLKKNSLNNTKQIYHNKMLSEIPVLSSVNMNLLNQNYNQIQNNNNDDKVEEQVVNNSRSEHRLLLQI